MIIILKINALNLCFIYNSKINMSVSQDDLLLPMFMLSCKKEEKKS